MWRIKSDQGIHLVAHQPQIPLSTLDGKPGKNSPLWSEVPRYFKSKPSSGRATRWNYVRDGSFLHDANGERLTKPGYSVLFVYFRDDT